MRQQSVNGMKTARNGWRRVAWSGSAGASGGERLRGGECCVVCGTVAPSSCFSLLSHPQHRCHLAVMDPAFEGAGSEEGTQIWRIEVCFLVQKSRLEATPTFREGVPLGAPSLCLAE